MKQLLIFVLSLSYFPVVFAGRVAGTITDENGAILPFASILLKGTTKGTIANSDGEYFLDLDPGKYTITCQYVGYNKAEKEVTLTGALIQLDFSLSRQQLTLREVVVKPGGEDPAYAIIRNAIGKRVDYLNQLDKFQCEVYIKGQIRMRDYPQKFFGQIINLGKTDTGKNQIIYLTESVAKYSVDNPGKSKIEVLSTRVSGSTDGFGLSEPQILSFYENIVKIGVGLNPRGFISPIANNALGFYRYRYEGSFYEDGLEINKIRVIPKRIYEPLFNGYINITEGDWRIHSLQLLLTKKSQMQLLDSLRIDQQYVRYNQDTWVIKSQVLYPSIKMFGFDGYGSFVNIYSKFDIAPQFSRKFFNSTILKYTNGSNLKPAEYWDSIRPTPLLTEEIIDYRKGDSLVLIRKNPKYLDSLDAEKNRIKITALVLSGIVFNNENKRSVTIISPLKRTVSYNPVEGYVINLRVNYSKRLDTINSRKTINLIPVARYGFHNGHFNLYNTFIYSYGKNHFSSINLSGGKRVYQFNNDNPVRAFGNSLSTLRKENNYLKVYEAWYGRIIYNKEIRDAIAISGSLQYQDRMPLENTTDYKWFDTKGKEFTPNYPEFLGRNIDRHQALIATLGAVWNPGKRFIEFPNRKINVGSNSPTFSILFTKGIKDLMGSDISYAKWNFSIHDDYNLKLLGIFRFRVTLGGFLNTDSLQAPDYHHFNANLQLGPSEYVNSFQLMPYYKYSTDNPLFSTLHVEHHFNGLLTNKIPGFRKLNWFLVGGSNALYITSQKKYVEAFVGLENIFKIIRVDFVMNFEPGLIQRTGFKVAIISWSRDDND